MRLHLSWIFAAACLVAASSARGQAIMMPANADMRAMQAPSDWEGSRAQHTQDGDPDAAKWSAPAASAAEPRVPTSPSPVPLPKASDVAASDFRVDVWNRDKLVDTMAHCSTLRVGKAAFKEAAKERPHQKVTLSEGAIVVATSEPAPDGKR